jgi:hypothetical protein
VRNRRLLPSFAIDLIDLLVQDGASAEEALRAA